jgi:hypothetical protein
MRFYSHLVLGCGVVSLAACAVNPANSLDNTLQSTMTQPLVQDSIMREGDDLSFQVLTPNSNNTLRTTVQFEAACSSPSVYLLYADGAQRVYPAGPRLYSSARELSPQLHATLAANQTFIQACAQTPKPDWRMVKTDERNNWVLLDRNSISGTNGEVRFWAAFDNPTVLNDMPYNAPYAQKREHFAVSCASASFKLLAGYDLDASNRISDGRVDVSPTVQPIAGSDADYQALFAQVCGGVDKTARLEPFKPRHKIPLTIALQSIDPNVLMSIGQLNLGQPSHSLKYLRTQGTIYFKDKPDKSGEEKFISVDAPSGQLSIVTRGRGYEGQSVNWRGLVQLTSKSNFSGGRGMAESSAVSQLSFSGDWKNLPLGEFVSYTSSTTTLNSIAGKYGGSPKTTRCKVERELSASELNPAFSGQAKALSCSTEPDEYQRVDHTYYLSDYGYFFHASTDKNRFFYDDYRIEAVE